MHNGMHGGMHNDMHEGMHNGTHKAAFVLDLLAVLLVLDKCRGDELRVGARLRVPADTQSQVRPAHTTKHPGWRAEFESRGERAPPPTASPSWPWRAHVSLQLQ